jgi:hypothetical protein
MVYVHTNGMKNTDDFRGREVKSIEKRMSVEANAIGKQIQFAHFPVHAASLPRLRLSVCCGALEALKVEVTEIRMTFVINCIQLF